MKSSRANKKRGNRGDVETSKNEGKRIQKKNWK